MFKRIFNELTLTFDLSPNEAPLLIKSGRESGADPTLLDMNFVRTIHPGKGETTVYLPGSSLKGTLRSYCEKIARTVRPEGVSNWCCNPFDPASFCGKRLEKIKSSAARYKGSCVACRTFGNTGLASHLALTDAYPLDVPHLEQRDGVAIDRIFNTVAAGPFNMEVVTRGTFRAKVTLRNFQLWQAGLLALALRELRDGHVILGFGRSKGFGRMMVAYHQIEFSYPGRFSIRDDVHDFSRELIDLTSFPFSDQSDYGLFPTTSKCLSLGEDKYEIVDDGKFGRVTVCWKDAASVEAILNASIEHWRGCALSNWSPSEESGDE